MGVAGRRRLVAQPGGLTLRFALHRVLIVSLIHYLFFFVSAVALTDSFPPSARRKLHLYIFFLFGKSQARLDIRCGGHVRCDIGGRALRPTIFSAFVSCFKTLILFITRNFVNIDRPHGICGLLFFA